MHSYGWIVRTTLNIKYSLIKKASKLIGIKEKTTIVRLGIKALIARESNKRLSQSGRAEKNLKISRIISLLEYYLDTCDTS